MPPDEAVLREIYESWAAPHSGSDGIIPYQVVNAWVLDDGRIAALTDGEAPPTVPVAPGQTVRLLFIYVKVNERYLIDDFRYVDIGAAGTPSPERALSRGGPIRRLDAIRSAARQSGVG